MIDAKESKRNTKKPNICIVGIGGAGNNAVDRMIENGNKNVKYIAINTDDQVLSECKAEITLQIGAKLTGGNGAGADPVIGEAAAKESKDEIRKLLAEADMVILTCGLGGGTGTGAIPVIAKLSREANILTVAVVTLPFSFEGPSRVLTAAEGLENLSNNVDTLLVVPNDKLLEISDEDLDLEEAFLFADNILKYTIDAVTNIIFNKGIVNIDFNDIRTTLKDKGTGYLGIGISNESRPLINAVKDAVSAPLLTTDIRGASNILINTSGRVKMKELNEAIRYVKEMAGPNSQIIWGTVTDSEKTEESTSVVTLIATGLKKPAGSGALQAGRAGVAAGASAGGWGAQTNTAGGAGGNPGPGEGHFDPLEQRAGSRRISDSQMREPLRPTVRLQEIVIPDFIKNRQRSST